jgi:hypothetical protein
VIRGAESETMKSLLAFDAPFVWVVSAYDRAWRSRRFVEAVLDAAASLNMVGTVDVVAIGDDQRSLPPPRIAAGLAGMLWAQSGPATLIGGGRTPQPWGFHVSSLTDEDGTMSTLTLRFGGHFSDEERSNMLWSTFRSTVGEDNATCAYVDGWDRCFELRDEARPLVSGATLETILWPTSSTPRQCGSFTVRR